MVTRAPVMAAGHDSQFQPDWWIGIAKTVFDVVVSQCHKPPMTGNGHHVTVKNVDDWGWSMTLFQPHYPCYTQYITMMVNRFRISDFEMSFIFQFTHIPMNVRKTMS